MFQKRMVSSAEAEAMVVPSGDWWGREGDGEGMRGCVRGEM